MGVRPDEREREQPISMDLRLGLDLSWPAHSGRISHTCDYDRVVGQVTALLRFRRYRLVEAAVEELAAMLFGVHPRLEHVQIRLAKPEALAGRARLAAVQIERARLDFPRRRERVPFGEVEVLRETREAGLYLLHVDPGREIRPHHHEVMEELEWLVSGDLAQNGEPVGEFEPTIWGHRQVHGYQNHGPGRATLFCCDCPPFVPGDEIQVSQAPAGRAE